MFYSKTEGVGGCFVDRTASHHVIVMECECISLILCQAYRRVSFIRKFDFVVGVLCSYGDETASVLTVISDKTQIQT